MAVSQFTCCIISTISSIYQCRSQIIIHCHQSFILIPVSVKCRLQTADQGRDPLSQNFPKFRYKIKWNGIFRKLCFENSGQPLEVVLFSENLEIPEIFCSIWHSIIKSICPTARAGSWLATLHKNANIYFLGAMSGRPCGFPTGMRPIWIPPWQRT